MGSQHTTLVRKLSWRSASLWLITGQIVLCGLLGGLVFAAMSQQAKPPFIQGRSSSPQPPSPSGFVGDDAFHLAGSGSNLPLTRALVQAFTLQAPRSDRRLVIHQSIGSTGGIRAVRDGAIHLGLISRPLSDDERRFGLTVVPYARVAVVVAANKSVPADGVSRAELLAIYRGKQTQWSDGSRIVVLQRERGDSSHRAAARVLPRFSSINEDAYRKRRWRIIYSDHDMQEALLSTPGAVGLFNLGAVVSQGLALKALSFDGVAPTQQASADVHIRCSRTSPSSAGDPRRG